MVVLRVEAIGRGRPDEHDQSLHPVDAGPCRLEAATLVDVCQESAGSDIDLADAKPTGVPQLLDFDPDRFALRGLVSLGRIEYKGQ